jgi:hypothetical protein
MPSPAPFQTGFLLFPDLTQLDLTGPYEVLSRLPGARPTWSGRRWSRRGRKRG